MLNNQEITEPIFIKDLGVQYTSESKKYRKRFALYKCFCGKEFKTSTNSIKSGGTMSCGCLQKIKASIPHPKHNLIKHPIYYTWGGMKNRILNKNNPAYKNYGGRGIVICDEWINDFKTFYEWSISNGWGKGLSIDRIDNDGNYEPDNCRWVNDNIQSRNKRVIQKNNKTGYRGVSLKSNGRYRSRVVVNNKHVNIGTFEKAIDAAKAYDKYIIDNNLEHNINFPD